jgi:hypothetical protein
MVKWSIPILQKEHFDGSGALTVEVCMAKKDEQKAKSNENGHNKVQGFVFGINLEGSKEVVLEGIKSFTAAMTAGGATTFAAPLRKSAALTSGSKSATATTIDAEEPDATEVAEVSEEEMMAPDMEEEETNSDGNGNGSAARRYVPPTPKSSAIWTLLRSPCRSRHSWSRRARASHRTVWPSLRLGLRSTATTKRLVAITSTASISKWAVLAIGGA